jgi:hydrogenase maturation protein HypF
MGSELKNTITVAYGIQAVISPHIGDLENLEAVKSLENVSECLPQFLQKRPEIVAVDMHPDMHCSILGKQIAATLNIPHIEVQHHHAHAMACLAENGMQEGLALVFDGMGLGPDGNIWGAELLEISGRNFRRLATFDPVPLPGGDTAVLNPVRQLVARWQEYGIEVDPEWLKHLSISEEQFLALKEQTKKRINSPMTHAAGRLFDSFSVLLGLAPKQTTYEGQTAIRLESAAKVCQENNLPHIPFSDKVTGSILSIDWKPAFSALADIHQIKDHETVLAMAVHHAVAAAAERMVEYGVSMTKQNVLALSGGVFMNGILNDLLIPRVQKRGIKVLIHQKTPPNDGCISLGQAVIAGQ